MRLKGIVLSFLFLISYSSFSQVSRPKLVVGIVVDQMRWDYLYRFQNRYGTTGFNRLLKEGFSCENTMIPYLPAYTAPGHTCIYTGSVPAYHGIIGNSWWADAEKDTVYCSDDHSVLPVGGSWKSGRMSPKNMLTTSVCDELRLSNNFQSRVFGIALKDRGGIFPAGHSANAAYWFDDSTGNWMTSSYYMKQLPLWVNDFNSKMLPTKYLQQNWNTLYPISTYTLSSADDKDYELHAVTESRPVFPHLTEKALVKKNFKEMRYSVYGNTLTLDFASSLIESEKLGKGSVTDFLAISFSTTDYVGHRFGPNSIEIEDTYLRLDKELGDFFKYLDKTVGKGEYLVFLTADHGVANIPAFSAEHNLPGGVFPENTFKIELSKKIDSAFNIKKVVKCAKNFQLFLDNEAIKKSGKEDEVYAFILKYCTELPFVMDAFYYKDLYKKNLPESITSLLKNGYNINRSGDLQIIANSGWYEDGDHAATHGVWGAYDRHIPLLFYGWNIKPGKTNREIYMTDIAPTISAILHIQMPSGCVGKVVTELMK